MGKVVSGERALWRGRRGGREREGETERETVGGERERVMTILYMHICIYVCIYMYTCMYVCIYIYMYIYAYIYIGMYACIHIYISYMAYIYIYIYIHHMARSIDVERDGLESVSEKPAKALLRLY